MTLAPVRAFVAVRLDDAARAALRSQIERLRVAAPRVAWLPAENLHLTLKFLGNVAAETLPRVTRALETVGAEASPFDLALCGLGAFPTATRARVIWAGVTAGRDAVGTLAERVEGVLSPLGFPREARPFSPHITLGRAREPRPDARLAKALARGAELAFGVVRVEALWLMRSDLSPGGARYSELAVVSLSGH